MGIAILICICHVIENFFSTCSNQQCRKVSEEQIKTLTSELILLQKKLVMKAVVGDETNTSITVSYPNVLLEFGKE